MIWFSTLFCFTLGLTASGKSFFKKKKPEPETSTPIREDQTTSIRDKKPDLDSSDDGKKMASPAERRTKNKREVSTSVQDWKGGYWGKSTHWFWQLKDLSMVQRRYGVLEGRGKSLYDAFRFDVLIWMQYKVLSILKSGDISVVLHNMLYVLDTLRCVKESNFF